MHLLMEYEELTDKEKIRLIDGMIEYCKTNPFSMSMFQNIADNAFPAKSLQVRGIAKQNKKARR